MCWDACQCIACHKCDLTPCVCRLLRWGSHPIAGTAFADLAALEAQHNPSQSSTHPLLTHLSMDTGTPTGFRHNSSQQSSPEPSQHPSRLLSEHIAGDQSSPGISTRDDLAEGSMLLPKPAQEQQQQQQQMQQPELLQQPVHALPQQQQHACFVAAADLLSQRQKHRQQHQLLQAGSAELSSPAWDDTGQGSDSQLPLEQAQRLSVMQLNSPNAAQPTKCCSTQPSLPNSQNAALTKSAAVDILSMQPAKRGALKQPPQGIAQLRPQLNLAAMSNSTAALSSQGQTSPPDEHNADDAMIAARHGIIRAKCSIRVTLITKEDTDCHPLGLLLTSLRPVTTRALTGQLMSRALTTALHRKHRC